MPSPFPGVDPYLENPELWSEVHSRLIMAVAISRVRLAPKANALAPSLRPKYHVVKLALAIRNRSHTGETHLRGFQNMDFYTLLKKEYDTQIL